MEYLRIEAELNAVRCLDSSPLATLFKPALSETATLKLGAHSCGWEPPLTSISQPPADQLID